MVLMIGYWIAYLSRGADSAPQFLGSQLSAVGQCAQLQPAEIGIHRAETREGSKSAIGAGDDALASHQAGVADDPLRDQLGMLDVVGTRCDNARNQDLVVRKLLMGPNFPFVLVARIRPFQQQRLRLGFETTGRIFASGKSCV